MYNTRKNKLNTQTTDMNETGSTSKAVERKLESTSLKNELHTNLDTKQSDIRRAETVTSKTKLKLATPKKKVSTIDRSLDPAMLRDGYKIPKGRGSQYYPPYSVTSSKKKTSPGCVTGNQMVRNNPSYSPGVEIGRIFEQFFRNMNVPSMGQQLTSTNDDETGENDDDELLDEPFG